jgi:hypothetical protein
MDDSHRRTNGRHAAIGDTVKHEHTVVDTAHDTHGVFMHVCDCGATREVKGDKVREWHTCALCTHNYGLGVK